MNREVQVRPLRQGFRPLEVAVLAATVLCGTLGYSRLHADAPPGGPGTRPIAVASNLAEATIETQRQITRLKSAEVAPAMAFEDIADGEMATTMAGVEFVISQRVDDYYWDGDSGRYVTAAPTGSRRPDFKRLAVTVSWECPLDSARVAGAIAGPGADHALDSGSVTLTAVISPPSAASGRLALVEEL